MSTSTDPTLEIEAARSRPHPAGQSHGLRNAGCHLTHRPNGASPRTFSIEQHQPIYHTVDERPGRRESARTGFRAIAGALLVRRAVSSSAHTLFSALLEKSNSKAHAVHITIWQLAEMLGWGETKVKDARRELADLGLLVWHNRKRCLDDGMTVNQHSNRYGFTWTPEICSMIGWEPHVANKLCGSSELVWNLSERKRRRDREAADEATRDRVTEINRQVEKTVDELMGEARHLDEAQRMVTSRFGGPNDPGRGEFAHDYLHRGWAGFAAVKRGQQLVRDGVPLAQAEILLAGEFGSKPELLELARASLLRDHDPF